MSETIRAKLRPSKQAARQGCTDWHFLPRRRHPVPEAVDYGRAMQMRWSDDMLTVTHETQTFNATSGGMDIEVHGEITASGEWWLRTAVGVLAMLPGKLNPEGTGHLLAPANAQCHVA
jgi:hypothetical protein